MAYSRESDGRPGNLDHLNYHTPSNLASIWPRYKQEFSVPDGITTTVYHFGFSEVTRLIHSFAYRSANDFRSEQHSGYCLGVKPECSVPNNISLPQDIRKMMDEQRSIQAALPENQRVHIGGEIEIFHLTKDGFAIYTLDRFEDYARDEKAIYENFQASNPKILGEFSFNADFRHYRLPTSVAVALVTAKPGAHFPV